MTSSREGGSGLPYPRRHDTGALPAPVTAKLWMEDAPATQTMMMVPPRGARAVAGHRPLIRATTHFSGGVTSASP
jgi:hypothetical protein